MTSSSKWYHHTIPHLHHKAVSLYDIFVIQQYHTYDVTSSSTAERTYDMASSAISDMTSSSYSSTYDMTSSSNNIIHDMTSSS
ncbi:hypothetical protein CEXT_285261 [Caerostris extrusa]|uniref:Uncharacterized protein n=1 Tax=Caerostris extrusa TaxID=172846 RepID=A0AAV4V8I7_CAEEX|nr:hypothetical protein CEXT_285261 [Caerostris extrusa]